MIDDLNPIPLFIAKDYFTHSSDTLEQSLRYFSSGEDVPKKIMIAFSAFREARQVYPFTEENFISGERVPLIEAEETNEVILFELMIGVYKLSFQLLRELLELVLLQFHMYLSQDNQFLNGWVRGKIDTPFKNKLKSTLRGSKLYELADQCLDLDSKLDNLYKTLSAYTHTKGVIHSHQGLKTANRPVFSKVALKRFSKVYFETIKYCVLLIAIHFPNAIIGLPTYEKFGYGGPIFFIDQDQAELVRAIFETDELSVLECIAEKNDKFQRLKETVEDFPDLTKEEIDRTWDEFERHT